MSQLETSVSGSEDLVTLLGYFSRRGGHKSSGLYDQILGVLLRKRVDSFPWNLTLLDLFCSEKYTVLGVWEFRASYRLSPYYDKKLFCIKEDFGPNNS